jgi:hypothetical protein
MTTNGHEESESILDDISELMREHLALDAWGRILITMERDGAGALRVGDVQIEEVFDEPRVDQAFGAPQAGALMQALAKGIEALCLLEGVDVEDVHGGTFLRADHDDGVPRVGFLPGLVRVPSQAYEGLADERMALLREREVAERKRFGLDEGNAMELDPPADKAQVTRGGVCIAEGSLVLVGTYAKRYRQWVWGSQNDSASEASRQCVRDALDAVPEREAWEISTPAFATDQRTAVGLAGWLALQQGWTTWIAESDGGLLIYAVFDLEPVATS